MGDKGIVEPITINNESTAGLVLIIFLIDFFFFFIESENSGKWPSQLLSAQIDIRKCLGQLIYMNLQKYKMCIHQLPVSCGIHYRRKEWGNAHSSFSKPKVKSSNVLFLSNQQSSKRRELL